jgi:lipopolysaccharide/colanic/teichoic acid biosynthesis glycosyltransferase
MSFYTRRGKRILDFSVAAVALSFLSPLLLVIAVAIKVTSPGTVFFRQQRVGLNGSHFSILKFRSMVPRAENRGAGITSSGDARVTAIGRILRKTKVDELPQLWNVLVGEMSLVGPRPELPKYVASYTSEQRQALSVRPGISSIASIVFRNEEELLATVDDKERFYLEVLVPKKNDLDRLYARRVNFANDIKVVVGTMDTVIRNRNAKVSDFR